MLHEVYTHLIISNMQSSLVNSLFFKIDLTSRVKFSPAEWRRLCKSLNCNLKILDKWLSKGFLHASWKQSPKWNISLVICGDRMMAKVNLEHRKKNKTTDVLSFPVHPSMRGKRTADDVGDYLGDILICWPQCQRQAQKYLIPNLEEFSHLLFHGFLHVVGFDHEKSIAEEKIMQKHEDDLMKRSRALIKY